MPGRVRPHTAGARRPFSAVHAGPRPSSANIGRTSTPPRSQKLQDPNLEIARTYYLEGVSLGALGPDGRKPVLQNFSIRLNPQEVSDSPLCEYMRIYYCDTLGVAPAKEFLERDQRTIDIEALCRWLQDATPRTRVDALPQLLMTKEVLRRFLSRDIVIVSARERRLSEELAERSQQLLDTKKLLSASEHLAADRLAEILSLQEGVARVQPLEEQLAQALRMISNLEAKAAKMEADAKAAAAAVNDKIEAVRKQTKTQADAAWDKRVQMASQQLLQAQVALDKVGEERDSLRQNLAQSNAKIAQLEAALEAVKKSMEKLQADAAFVPAQKVLSLLPTYSALEVLRIMKTCVTLSSVGAVPVPPDDSSSPTADVEPPQACDQHVLTEFMKTYDDVKVIQKDAQVTRVLRGEGSEGTEKRECAHELAALEARLESLVAAAPPFPQEAPLPTPEVSQAGSSASAEAVMMEQKELVEKEKQACLVRLKELEDKAEAEAQGARQQLAAAHAQWAQALHLTHPHLLSFLQHAFAWMTASEVAGSQAAASSSENGDDKGVDVVAGSTLEQAGTAVIQNVDGVKVRRLGEGDVLEGLALMSCDDKWTLLAVLLKGALCRL